MIVAFSHLLLGFIVSFIGSIPPASINLLVIKIASTKGIKKALAFAAGAVFVEFVYSFIAILFSKYLLENQSINQTIQLVAIPVFLLLGCLSLFKRSKPEDVTEIEKGNEFVNGLFMGLINPLQIPFWMGYSSYFISIGWLKEDFLLITIFVIGIVLGTFLLLFIFAFYSKKWFYENNKSNWNGNMINKIIGWIFITLAIVQAGKIFFWGY